MNWEVFSQAGYVSVVLWLCVPVLWLLHQVWRPRRFVVHVAVVVAVVAVVLAQYNSNSYVIRIQVDRQAEAQEQVSRAELARQAALSEREGEVTQMRRAEDARVDILDLGGLDDEERAYIEGLVDDDEPDWKKAKKTRSADGGADADDLESMIGAGSEREGVDADEFIEEEETVEPIIMSDKDKALADRMDRANLKASRWLLLFAVLMVAFDYVRRLNSYREAYLPLPVPSSWADALTPREPVTTRPDKPRRSKLNELRMITRRGEAFVYFTDNADEAGQATTEMPRLPAGLRPVRVLSVSADPKLSDAFVFETLWFTRNSFVVDSADRAKAMLDRFLDLLEDRRRSRAHTGRTVHVVWDVSEPISEADQQRFAELGRSTGFTLLICTKPSSNQTTQSATQADPTRPTKVEA